MARGGARNRSGPPPDPSSGRSERRGYTLTALPNEGYTGKVPPLTDFIPKPTPRELKVWAQLWTTPQACAWSQQAWRWPVLADLARYMVRGEADGAPVNLATAVRQLRDDCGLSEAGMKANGWAIAAVEVGAAPEKTSSSSKPAAAPVRRLRVANDGGA